MLEHCTTILNIHDIIGTKLLTRLRVEFSDLRYHKFRHNFNCSCPSCKKIIDIEDNEHFLLHCLRFATKRRDLLDVVSSLSDVRLAPSPSRMRIFEKKRSVILVAGERDLYFTRGYE